MIKKLYIILAASLYFLLPSCKYTKHVPEGRLLLWDNNIHVNSEKGAPAKAYDILKQEPNSGIWVFTEGFGFYLAPGLAVYNIGNGKEKNIFSKLGDAPEILDTSKVYTGAKQLRVWYFNNGYFNASSSYRIDSIKAGKRKAAVNYFIQTGKRYYVNNYSYEIETPALLDLVAKHAEESLLEVGEPYNAELLDDERDRLAALFRNDGFYGFNKGLILYEADTVQPGDSVTVKMVISQKPVEAGDSTLYTDHRRYRINKVYIQPDKNYSIRSSPQDTLEYRNYLIAYDTLGYKPRYLTDAIHFRPGQIYSSKAVRETYSHLVSYNAFQLSEVTFVAAGSDSTGPLLNAVINLSPLEKRTLTFEPEITTTNVSYFGGRVGIGYVNRNLFKAGERLQIKFNAGVEKQPTNDPDRPTSTTVEVGAEANLKFPRFLLPFNTVGLVPKRMQPTSLINGSVSQLKRDEFQRLTFRTGLSYQWRQSQRKYHQINLFDLTYSRLDNIDPDFFDRLTDIQQAAFTSEFISATRYSYTYNEQLDPNLVNHRFFTGNVEVAGNTSQLIDQLTNAGETVTDGPNEFFGVPYYQYLKLEGDARYYWNFDPEHSWVNRIFSGYILPYGNSHFQRDDQEVRVPPFSKYYFMGGSNDLRAWAPYRLGAGTQYNTNYDKGTDTTFATGTFKLLLNSEYRFPIFSSLKGALFIDAGNVWYTGGLQNNQTELSMEALYKELAVGTGIGLRIDLDFFVIRFDMGVKVRDPGLISEGREWVLFTETPNIPKNFSYHVALGYPF